jgi:putative ABC transport system ATP-binding protein
MTTKNIIQLSALGKTYCMPNYQLDALKNIHFTLQQGELVAIVGESGSGKSTLMNILGLIDQPSSGSYLLNGTEVADLSDNMRSHFRNHMLGFVFQQFFLLPQLNAIDNVSIPLRYRNVDKKTCAKLSRDMLERVEMGNYVSHKPHELSGGQQQRVAIARALVGNPSLILADEPTGALDSRTSQEVMNLLFTLHRDEGKTIIIITHNHSIATQCERIVTMKDGEMIETVG